VNLLQHESFARAQTTQRGGTANLKTAKVLAMKMPPSILVRADRVIE
jgi:hypothetical protein